jgi:large subunit ribosomal protein L2
VDYQKLVYEDLKDVAKKFEFEVKNKYKVLSNEYDPIRNSLISAVKCLNSGDFNYILSIKDLNPGDVVSAKNRITNGGRYLLKDLPPNYLISNIEFKPKKGGQISRSSGMFCKILQNQTH